jgi:GNAT superfamily N-acetyltransferase
MSSSFEIIAVDYGNVSHVRDLLSLLNEYASGLSGGGKPLSADVCSRLVPELACRPGISALLAYAGGEPAGLLIANEGFSTFAAKSLLNIHDLMVSARFRGQGLSRLLLARAEQIARLRGCCKLTLEVLEGNTAARAVYSKVGFKGYELDPAMGKALFLEKKL